MFGAFETVTRVQEPGSEALLVDQISKYH